MNDEHRRYDVHRHRSRELHQTHSKQTTASDQKKNDSMKQCAESEIHEFRQF
jgi:hypothetical protein